MTGTQAFFLISFLPFLGFAQGNEILSYPIDKDGKACEQEEAVYTRTLFERADTLLDFKDTYSNGQLFRQGTMYFKKTPKTSGTTGKAESSLNTVLHGPVEQYYPNGQKELQGFYNKNLFNGEMTVWYRNGQEKLLVLAENSSGINTRSRGWSFNLRAFNDSLGNSLVKEGNGLYLYSESGQLLDSGLVKDGVKEGWWTSKYPEYGIIYKEYFEAGEFDHGIKIKSDGSRRKFTKADEEKDFLNFQLFLIQYVNKTFKYPEEARQRRIQGRVFVSFVIEIDGTITNVEVARGVHPLLDNEAVRVINAMGKLDPEMILSPRPGRMSFTVPMSAKLQ